MPDMSHPRANKEHSASAVSIGEALRALPLDAPPQSVWPAVRPKPARLPKWPYALATAAALALALLLPVPPASVPEIEADDEAQGFVAETAMAGMPLATLQSDSARLERLIAAVNDDPLQPADALVLGLAFEDEIARIDGQLAAAPDGSRDALDLWQQRVDVLSRYAELQSSRQLLASAGQPFETTLVALH